MDGAEGRAVVERAAGAHDLAATGVGGVARHWVHAPAATANSGAGGPGGPGGVQKGGLAATLGDLAVRYPTADIALWAQDEHRLGLLPLTRRVWAPRGQRPVADVDQRYQWLYVYGFVRPSTGQSWWCLLPTVSTEAMGLALAAFARDEGIDAAHRAALVLDGAGWHTSGELPVPTGIDLVRLPRLSPELQPAERLWPLVDEPVANRSFADLDALEAVLIDRCQTLRADPAMIQAHTQFHWWPTEPVRISPD